MKFKVINERTKEVVGSGLAIHGAREVAKKYNINEKVDYFCVQEEKKLPVKPNIKIMTKKRTMNELRQTKEYYVAKQKVLSDGGFDTNEEMKQIAACVKEIEQIPSLEYLIKKYPNDAALGGAIRKQYKR